MGIRQSVSQAASTIRTALALVQILGVLDSENEYPEHEIQSHRRADLRGNIAVYPRRVLAVIKEQKSAQSRIGYSIRANLGNLVKQFSFLRLIKVSLHD